VNVDTSADVKATRTQPDFVTMYAAQFKETSVFLARAATVGFLAGCSIVAFKLSIVTTQGLLYDDLADVLPHPAPYYWTLVLFPLLGGAVVSLITALAGPRMKNGIDTIASSIDENVVPARDVTGFRPLDLVYRIGAAVATLGSGNSLGPEGSAVEIGTGMSRIVARFGAAAESLPPQHKRDPVGEGDADVDHAGAGTAAALAAALRVQQETSRLQREQHHLFLAGAAAGVAGGFNAPIAGVFFAIEVGNRYLSRNTIKLDEEAPDGPRADIAAIVLAAAVSNLVVSLGLHESVAFAIQGNTYAMESPLFELPVYLGLGLFSGVISVVFEVLRDAFTALYAGTTWAEGLPFARIPVPLRPLLGGLLCGIVGVFWPQTLFVGYATLDQFISGKITFPTPLVLQLLGLKLTLSSFCLASGLVGGVFAPALFFGAAAGTAYHSLVVEVIAGASDLIAYIVPPQMDGLSWPLPATFWTVANAPAYATVGAAATLGAVFRAPLTSSMLMFELTQNHDVVSHSLNHGM
jgi:H+/Cl- antiporter ClcA